MLISQRPLHALTLLNSLAPAVLDESVRKVHKGNDFEDYNFEFLLSNCSWHPHQEASEADHRPWEVGHPGLSVRWPGE